MKITGLKIDSYRHLQNLDFDFTYPEGHLKAGKPLDKICFIGQSASGKTSIVELIKDATNRLNEVRVSGNNEFYVDTFKFPYHATLTLEHRLHSFLVSQDKITRKPYHDIKPRKGFEHIFAKRLFESNLKLLYFSTDIISKETIKIFNQNPVDILNAIDTQRLAIPYEFGPATNEQAWYSLLKGILDYRKQFTQMAAELISKSSIGDITALHNELQKWSAKNKNPLARFAEHFNPVLDKLNLEVDVTNTEYTIPIKLKNKAQVIPISSLSTGTKGLLLSMFPLYELDTTDSVVIVDEPERSLFPDMQIDLMSHYLKLAPNAQFIVATHSPFIAASFEPEERFILYFDKEGNVKFRRGESPIGDDPNDILANDFNIDYYNDFGKKAYERYLDLKKRAAEEVEPQKKKELVKELSELGDKYNF